MLAHRIRYHCNYAMGKYKYKCVCMSACVLLNDVVEIVPVCSWPALCSPRHDDVPLVSSYSWHKPRDRKSPKKRSEMQPTCQQEGKKVEYSKLRV